jgi:pyruvate dehydrogenase E1 component alpha subunit
VVFLCENNGWAISMRADRQTAAPSIAAKADAYGFDGVQVDGNDPLAVYETVSDALETARTDEPVLVENLTYRQGAHTTSDDPSRYREEPDLPEWRTRDPIERVTEYLADAGVVDAEFVADARDRAESQVEAAVGEAEVTPDLDPDDVFDYAYSEVPPRLVEQRAEMRSRVEADAGSDEPTVGED